MFYDVAIKYYLCLYSEVLCSLRRSGGLEKTNLFYAPIFTCLEIENSVHTTQANTCVALLSFCGFLRFEKVDLILYLCISFSNISLIFSQAITLILEKVYFK